MAFETGQATIAETEKLTEARAAIEEALASSSAPCLTCSFQAEDMAVLALIREKAPDIPVLFLETGYHFAETYQYRDEMTARYGLNLVNVIPKQTVAEQESQFGILNRTAPDRCCKLRKVEPLFSSLEGYDTWFTGLRRVQSPTRANLAVRDLFPLPTGKKIPKSRVRSPRGLIRTFGPLPKSAGFRCCRFTKRVIRALAANHARCSPSIPRIFVPDAGPAARWNAAFT